MTEYGQGSVAASPSTWTFLTLFTCFSGLIFYIVLWICMPEKNLLEK